MVRQGCGIFANLSDEAYHYPQTINEKQSKKSILKKKLYNMLGCNSSLTVLNYYHAVLWVLFLNSVNVLDD